ncbi:MAG: hypothetical protein ABIK65_08730 [Candidatus Eisenbacteria bacterium]
MTLRLLLRLPAFLRDPLTLPEARTILRHRLERREADFLDLARRAIYENRASPYRSLLELARCEYGDLERLVRCEGVEGALRGLFREGVYLTVDEFKGRRPVVRGGTVIVADPARLRNPLSTPHLWATTSGSRGAPTRIQLDLASVRDRAVNMCLALDARGGARWRNAVWSTRGVAPLLWYSGSGTPVARWFLQIDPKTLGPGSPFLWCARLVTWTSRLAGVSLPAPEHAPVDAPIRIVRWMEETLREGEVPHLWGSPSSVVRLCRAAEGTGANLAGARFTITGEPVTEARLAAVRRIHGDAVPDYGSADSGGSVGYGCLSPEAPDEIHLFGDLNAVIQADAPPFPGGALLVSSLRSTAPFVFLNVSMGDRATITERRCGCPLEILGWSTHLHTIRSYEKLTAGGVTFEDTDVIRILEETLPRRFGGGPTDYQLVEEETDDGQPRLRLLVHPSIGPVDATAVADAFLDAIGAGSGTGRDMARQWRKAGYLSVEREAPRPAASGKILHLIAGSSAHSRDPRAPD